MKYDHDGRNIDMLVVVDIPKFPLEFLFHALLGMKHLSLHGLKFYGLGR